MDLHKVVAENFKQDNGGKFHPLVDKTLDTTDIVAATETLFSGQLSMGETVFEFERQFAKYIGSKYAVMVNSGSSANLLALYSLVEEGFISRGTEVLVPAICWSTSVAPIVQCGLKPVFVDINPDTLNIDINDLISKISERTSAIMLVHVLGLCCEMSQLIKAVNDFKEHMDVNIHIIEDTCESLGTTYDGKKLGTYGTVGTFSFFYSHHITTGEGGMIVTDNYLLYNSIVCMRAHGWTRNMHDRELIESQFPNIDPRFLFIRLGFNFRPMEISGALGISQLKKLDSFNEQRNQNYEFLRSAIESDSRFKHQFSFTNPSNGTVAARFGFVIIVNKPNTRNKFIEHLEKNGIETRPIVSGDFTIQPVIERLDIEKTQCPGASHVGNNGLFIGLHSNPWSQEKIKKIVDIFYDQSSI